MSRRPSTFISHEAPFSSLAFRDDGWTLAVGTSNSRVVFYDIGGKQQPFTVLCAYSSSEVSLFFLYVSLFNIKRPDHNNLLLFARDSKQDFSIGI